jgi:hypothetical protein
MRFNAQKELEMSEISQKSRFWRRYRPAAVGAGALVVLVLLLAVPSFRAAAINFLGLFRVQQIEVVPVNPANLPEQLGSSSSLELLLAEDVEVQEIGEPQQVSGLDEAAQASGLAVRQAEVLEGPAQYWVQPGSQVTLKADLARLERILAELGREDIQLPANLDDATITLAVSPSVLAGYGECEFQRSEDAYPDAGRLGECTTLLQMPSPTITAPPQLDIASIGTAFLQIMGMSQAEAERFSETVDWATTLVIPVPRYGVSYEQVVVDGVEGTLMAQGQERPNPRYMLLWVKQGMVYALSGQGDAGQAMRIANSLR